jgi:hypothetical protein
VNQSEPGFLMAKFCQWQRQNKLIARLLLLLERKQRSESPVPHITVWCDLMKCSEEHEKMLKAEEKA